jgi:L-ascorbate metabolism protein UlaG (beta-lactamase superfamily)
MKPAFQADDAFLEDLAQARKRGRSRLWWLGQSGFLVSTPEATLLLDPYLSDSLTEKYAATDKPHIRMVQRVIDPHRLIGIDLITSSHNHTDHLDGRTLGPVLVNNPEARLIIGPANRAFVLERLGPIECRLVELDAGQSARVGSVTLHGIPAAHNSVERDESGYCRFLGFVVEVAGQTLYHSGDTMLHDELVPALRGFNLDVALLPINGHAPHRRVAGNMTGREAARLARQLNARIVIPHHFDMFEFNTASPEEFIAECQAVGQRFAVLENGQGWDLTRY